MQVTLSSARQQRPAYSLPVGSAARIGTDEAVLSQLMADEVAVAVWRRSAAFSATAEFARLADEHFRWEGVDAADVASALPDWLSAASRSRLASELSWATATVTALSGGQPVKLSLASVCTDMCRKFHVDYIALRLVCTLFGPGTEWLPEHAVRRDGVGNSESDVEVANQLVLGDEAAIQRVGTGDVLVMKGAAHPRSAAIAAVHRSPPVQHSGQHRLVLTVTARTMRGVG